MKIAILTLRLHSNYGGILQAFALQRVLSDLGHEVYTFKRDRHWSIKLLGLVKRFVESYIFRTSNRAVFKYEAVLERNVRVFCKQHIMLSQETVRFKKDLLSMHNKYKFDAYIVGSDQVWRPEYAYRITDFYLDFLEKESPNILRLAYAASFGGDWNYSEKQTQICRKLIKRFNGVSVRESSAVDICKEYLETNAVVVLDPTLLLDKEDYVSTITSTEKPNGELLSYYLDPSEEKKEIVNLIEKLTGFKSFSVMPEEILTRETTNLNKCIFPSVTSWLQGFQNAKFVITDSFHGCVFSIIFNVPFIAIANKKRGLDRFTSLLSIFNLMDRLIFSFEDITESLINQPIVWEEVNAIREQWKCISFKFITDNLK